jgi:hypothetical protein
VGDLQGTKGAGPFLDEPFYAVTNILKKGSRLTPLYIVFATLETNLVPTDGTSTPPSRPEIATTAGGKIASPLFRPLAWTRPDMGRNEGE